MLIYTHIYPYIRLKKIAEFTFTRNNVMKQKVQIKEISDLVIVHCALLSSKTILKDICYFILFYKKSSFFLINLI